MAERLPEKEGVKQERNDYGFWHYVCPYCNKNIPRGLEQHITKKHPEKRKRCSKCGQIIKEKKRGK